MFVVLEDKIRGDTLLKEIKRKVFSSKDGTLEMRGISTLYIYIYIYKEMIEEARNHNPIHTLKRHVLLGKRRD